jgi:hypothetical protein
LGAAGARRPAAGHRRHTTYYIYFLPAGYDVLPFNTTAQYRESYRDQQTFSTTSSSSRHHQQHLLDIIIFSTTSSNFFMIINKLS